MKKIPNIISTKNYDMRDTSNMVKPMLENHDPLQFDDTPSNPISFDIDMVDGQIENSTYSCGESSNVNSPSTIEEITIFHVVVFDLDETLINSKKPYGNGPILPLNLNEISETELRPWATDILRKMAESKMRVFALTAGTQKYAEAVMQAINTHVGFPIIEAAASCRNSANFVQLKSLKQILPPDVHPEFAIIVDNRREAWEETFKSQVVICADYLPGFSASETVLLQVWTKICQVINLFTEFLQTNGKVVRVGTILPILYEIEEKARMYHSSVDFRVATDVTIGGPVFSPVVQALLARYPLDCLIA